MSSTPLSLLSTESATVHPLPVRALPAPGRRVITSQRLLDGERELVIQHQGSEYHLRLTRNDKLILTK